MNNGVSQVLQRIHAIVERFSPDKAQRSTSFDRFMSAAMKNEKGNAQSMQASLGLNPKNKAASAPTDITQMINQSAHKYGVDPRLVDAVAQTESNYRTNAVSEAGAVGIMQLMPQTAASLGVTDIYNPRENIEGGVKYIKQLLNTFNGDVSKALAAYNAGPQAVKNHNGIPPYDETKNYVKKVLDLYS